VAAATSPWRGRRRGSQTDVNNHLVGYVSALASMAEGTRTHGIGKQRCSILALSVGGLG
jgi:hypothetical protein